MFEIYKPKERLKLNDSYRSKPQIASQMIREIKAMAFEIDCVLADSLYGESTSTFIRCLQGLNLQFAVAIRSNHGVRLPPEQRVRANKWRKFERIFSDGSREVRYIREIIYGKKIVGLIQPSTPRLHYPTLHPQKTAQFSTALSNIKTLDEKNSWKSHLNNLRLMLQPLISFNLIQQWLKVFPIPQLSTGLARLRALMNFYPNPFSHLMNESEFLFSSA